LYFVWENRRTSTEKLKTLRSQVIFMPRRPKIEGKIFKASISPKPPYPVCPSCGSHEFKIDGYVGYIQPYDAKTGAYAMSR